MIGFIGTGNMATAIIKGVVSSGMQDGSQIAVFNRTPEKALALAKKYSLHVLSGAKEIAEKCSVVVLCVKPNMIADVASEIKEEIEKHRPLIISVAAGKTLDFLSEKLGKEARIIRVMPNINAVVGQSVSAFCPNENADESDVDFAEKLCSAFGRAVRIPESQFSIFSAIGGCSPAFAYMFIDSLARAAVKNGMPKALALEVSAQAVLGSAKMVLESGEHPWQLVDKVCSPGGTTIEGVAALEKAGFQSAVTDAVCAAFDKDKKL
ncbi:MAG: pyrroline-5-carboxylate reductase [Acutalibacteraceae bacterium]